MDENGNPIVADVPVVDKKVEETPKVDTPVVEPKEDPVSETVPYARFKEKNDKLKALEAEKASFETYKSGVEAEKETIKSSYETKIAEYEAKILEADKEKILATYKIEGEAAKLVTGKTKEEIEASAKLVSEVLVGKKTLPTGVQKTKVEGESPKVEGASVFSILKGVKRG